jgi:hypothetical protein
LSRSKLGVYLAPSLGVVGFEVVGHKAETKVCADRWQPEIVCIENGLLAAALPHTVQDSEGYQSP